MAGFGKRRYTLKAVTIILGILLVALGTYCTITPIETYSVISWLIGFSMIVEGVGSAITWNERRLLGLADVWTLIGAIASIVLGAFLLGSYVMQSAVDYFIAYVIAAWLIIGGVTRVIAAFNVRDFQDVYGTDMFGSNWIIMAVFGVLIVLFGVLCVLNPTALMAGVGFMLGFSILMVGLGFISRGMQM